MNEIARGNKAVTPTMDELLEQRRYARSHGDHETADDLSAEIERRAAEDEARHH